MPSCALVARVSDPRQVSEDDQEIRNQLGQLHSYIEWRNRDRGPGEDQYRIHAQYTLVGIRGRDSFDSEQFRALKDEIKKGKIDIVMATGLDRFGRNVIRFLEFFKFLRKHNVDLVVTHYQIDTSTPIGELVITILMALAEMQSKQYSRKTLGSRHQQFIQGRKSGGSLPLGFDRRPGKPGYYVVNEHEAHIVRQIFHTYIKTKSFTETARIINKKGYRTKRVKTRKGNIRGGVKFTASSIKYILQNWVYVGVLEEHKENKGRDPDEVPEKQQYRRHRPKNHEDWPAIVDEDVFEQANKIIEESGDHRKKGTRRTHHYILSGLVYCQSCGQKMKADKRTGETSYYYYVCENKECPARQVAKKRGGRRARNSISAPLLEDGVKALIGELASRDSEAISHITRCANKRLKEAMPAWRRERDFNREHLRSVEEEIGGIYIAMKRNENDGDTIAGLNDDLKELMGKRDRLISRISEIERNMDRIEANTLSESQLREVLKELSRHMTVLTCEQQREFLEPLIDRVEVGVDELELRLLLYPIIYCAERGPEEGYFDWRGNWYARQESNPEPSGP